MTTDDASIPAFQQKESATPHSAGIWSVTLKAQPEPFLSSFSLSISLPDLSQPPLHAYMIELSPTKGQPLAMTIYFRDWSVPLLPEDAKILVTATHPRR